MKETTTRPKNSLALEGGEALERVSTDQGPLPCVVRHEDAGGQCLRPAVMAAYGLYFCEIHGAEVKAGALEESYFDAANYLERLDNPYVPGPNPAATGALREAVSGLRDQELRTYSGGSRDAALRRAYPLIPERVDEDAADYDYNEGVPGESPLDWNYDSRMLIHKLMRIAHEAGHDHYLVEMLEQQRERVSAQLSFALASYEEWKAKRTEEAGVVDGG
jgi:hypothetical protein